MTKKITLTIEEVALRQLESAIWMYAYDFDEAAVHTIAAAAYEILTKRLKLGDYEEKINKNIIDGKERQFWTLVNKPYNFFKHGEHQYKELNKLEYYPDSVELILMAACYANSFMSNTKQLSCTHAFMAFMMIQKPDLFQDGALKIYAERMRKEAAKAEIDVKNKKFLVVTLNKIKKPTIA